MKLHEWQDRYTVARAADIARRSLEAGASQDSAAKAAERELERLLLERAREAQIKTCMALKRINRVKAMAWLRANVWSPVE